MMADTADMEEGEGNGEGAGADASAGEEGTSGAIRNYGLIVLGTVLRFMIPSWDLAWEMTWEWTARMHELCRYETWR